MKTLEKTTKRNCICSKAKECATSAFAMLSVAVCNNCTITFTNLGNASVGDNEQQPKRRRIIIESDEEY